METSTNSLADRLTDLGLELEPGSVNQREVFDQIIAEFAKPDLGPDEALAYFQQHGTAHKDHPMIYQGFMALIASIAFEGNNAGLGATEAQQLQAILLDKFQNDETPGTAEFRAIAVDVLATLQ